MQMTVEEAVINHRKLWDAIVKELETNGINKRTAIQIKAAVKARVFPELDGICVTDNCFLCDFASQFHEYGERDCTKCPMVDGEPNGCMDYRYGEFRRACPEDDLETALRLAKEIAAHPVINKLYEGSECYGS